MADESLKSESFERENKINILFLKCAGLVAFEKKSLYSLETILLLIYGNVSMVFIMIMYLSTALMNAYKGLIDFEVIAGCIGFVSIYIRYVLSCFHRADLSALLVKSKKLWTLLKDSEEPIICDCIRIIRRLSVLYFGINVSCAIGYIIINEMYILLNKSDLESMNERKLLYSFAMDVRDSPSFEIMFALQILATCGFDLVVVGFEMAPTYFIMMAAAHFKLLCKRFEDAQKTEKNLYRDVIACVIHHQKINRFCKDISNITNSFFMVQLLSSTYNLSILLYAITTDNKNFFKLIPVTILQVLQLFSCHWICDFVISESKRLSESTYIIPSVYNANVKVSKIIQIVLLKAQNPMQLKAGGYINLSLECFGDMITSAVSFFITLCRISNV